MYPRTPYALLIAGLFLATGAVSAEDARTTTDPATATGFALAISQHEAWTKPDAPFTFAVKAYARGSEVLTLTVRAADGVRATISPDVLTIDADEPARAALTVAASEPAREGYPIVVTATDEDGNEQSVRALLRVVAPEATTPAKPYAERPSEPKPYADAAIERRLHAIMERLERIERYLGLDRAAYEPKPVPPPTPAPAVRAALATPDAVVGPEGARIALLIQAGEHDARLPLAVRFDDASGWKVSLEEKGAFVRAGERTWLWVHLVPGEDAAPLKYAVVLKDPAGIVLAEGTATARMP